MRLDWVGGRRVASSRSLQLARSPSAAEGFLLKGFSLGCMSILFQLFSIFILAQAGFLPLSFLLSMFLSGMSDNRDASPVRVVSRLRIVVDVRAANPQPVAFVPTPVPNLVETRRTALHLTGTLDPTYMGQQCQWMLVHEPGVGFRRCLSPCAAVVMGNPGPFIYCGPHVTKASRLGMRVLRAEPDAVNDIAAAFQQMPLPTQGHLACHT